LDWYEIDVLRVVMLNHHIDGDIGESMYFSRSTCLMIFEYLDVNESI